MTDAEAAKNQEETQVENVDTEVKTEETTEEAPVRQNRNEKKARRLMQKLGMKPFPNVTRVTVKKSRTILFGINKPDVFKMPNSDTFIVFGEAKVEDLSAKAKESAAKQFQAGATQETEENDDDVPELTEADGEAVPAAEEGADEEGVNPKDIELVMQQANTTRAKAVAALKKSEGDIVNAIMELSM
mmetsp:Transcript_32364/g.47566  ORF Transcript_32364/g.47566 Transcript_32364/m.47566 type:complete len:187 (-) Transcript_32364:186-746(-)|eukprot:CAMPEP_0195519066 /NCGR_PEP_ID=MMETSP0794_2-20130614/14294_1 /TAXON_ID=515487 /ORGANISM="Stephanopyxis turris, Strain CCMP 815" /LENGTH=186 /DNA_ID=CAMNT_0040648159 /DNA_START=76 /DNA_END=636 /DNA_ORIENTATION=+